MPGPTLPSVTYDKAKALKARRVIIVFTPSLGVKQVTTATAVGTITTAGNLTVTVTGAGITGSPVVLSVPVLVGDTPAAWAHKVRLAIAANANITNLYAIAAAFDATITLTRLAPAANDGTLNIAIANGTSVGATAAPTSAATTAGATTGTPVNIIGKLSEIKGDTTVVTSKFTDAAGMARDIDHLATEGVESITLKDMEDVDTVLDFMGGVSGLVKGAAQAFFIDPADVPGKVRLLSEVFPCAVQRAGNISTEAFAKNPTLEFLSEKLGKIDFQKNADVTPA
jgi:hypothetical protein